MSDPVSRLNAALEGRYSIDREVGEDGMATVYLADDLKHERRVALKVLKPALVAVVTTLVISACSGSDDCVSGPLCDGESVTEGLLGTGFADEQFSLIPAGTFQMGSTNGDSDEQPVHTVNITRSFDMQKTEVTGGQWRDVMGSNPSLFNSLCDGCPVDNVSWNDIQEFIIRLNAQDPGRNYRLPTEAEWEYAARAGTTGDYGGTGNLDEMGWYGDDSGSPTAQLVARKQPNAWGLYDIHGNVWEWVQDWYSHYNSQSPTDDPVGPTTGASRVLRGGAWNEPASSARSAHRNNNIPSSRFHHYGFRLARTP